MDIEDHDDDSSIDESEVTGASSSYNINKQSIQPSQGYPPRRCNPPRKAKKKSTATTYRLLKQENPRADNYTNDEMDYYMGLDPDVQTCIADVEKRLINKRSDSVPLRFRILQSGLDDHAKAITIKKLDILNKLDASSSEFVKNATWLEALSRLPVGKYAPLPISLTSDITEKQFFLNRTKERLDKSVYGHINAKEHVMRLLAQWLTRPDSKGLVIGLVGPMGTGKTQFALHGIAKSLDLPFMFVTLGGANDCSVLDGFAHTYEGSTYGRIAEGLMRSGVTNPVIYFDELDKISDSNRGEEVMNLLIHLTDPTQNHKFIDKYFGSNIPIDLSRSLMIFSFNSLESVNPILRDRMYCVHVKGYDVKDKINIAVRHLIPEILDQHGMGHDDIIFSEEVLRGIINSHLSPQEAGVRGLKRAIGVVVGQINLLRVMGKVDVNDKNPYKVNKIEEINDWLKNGLHDVRDLNSLPHMMYL